MKKLFLVLTACALAFAICSCEPNPENCNHDYTEFQLCKKCGHYNGISANDSKGRKPRLSWTLGDNIYLQFETEEAANYKLILSSSKTGLPHDSWYECTENLKCFDAKGNEIKLHVEQGVTHALTLSELKANTDYYLSFKYIKEPLFYPSDKEELQAFIDIYNEDKSTIYFWVYPVKE